jgi:transglutaminase-like putative cysteine protease
MILEIQHETRFSYTEPVTESIAEFRMEPVSDLEQSCRSFHLIVEPSTGVTRFTDGFVNRVHHFNVLPPHLEMRVLAASIVETHPKPKSLSDTQASYPLDPSAGGLELLDFLHLRGPTKYTPKLEPILERLRPTLGTNAGQAVASVSQYVHDHFQYARSVTLVTSSVEDVLEHGKGVCQDFTHVMLALLRSLGIPARYVSGYIHRPGEESQSHAWCEVWFPDLGWVGIDPTNNAVADDRFVKVAIGRDFTDVPPNKGLFKGKAEEKISVRVETRQLETLPSLSWKDQLPELQTPLTAIVSAQRALELLEDDGSQQQQQQQQ